MLLKNSSGMSLIEIMISLTIFLMISTMVHSFFSKNERQRQESKAIDTSHETMGIILDKIKRMVEIRDASAMLNAQANALSFKVPIDSTASANYQVNITTKCRPLPSGASLILNSQDIGASCLQSKCQRSIPFIEITYIDHPQLTIEQWPSAAGFKQELKKHASTAGYALCFNTSSSSLEIKGVAVSLLRDARTNSLTAKLKSKTLVMPIDKRNGINLIP